MRGTCQKMKSWKNGEVRNIDKKEREFKIKELQRIKYYG